MMKTQKDGNTFSVLWFSDQKNQTRKAVFPHGQYSTERKILSIFLYISVKIKCCRSCLSIGGVFRYEATPGRHRPGVTALRFPVSIFHFSVAQMKEKQKQADTHGCYRDYRHTSAGLFRNPLGSAVHGLHTGRGHGRLLL